MKREDLIDREVPDEENVGFDVRDPEATGVGCKLPDLENFEDSLVAQRTTGWCRIGFQDGAQAQI